ncbi:SDR family oxidoreductase [Haloechinothrix salitolerans]|uniref:SDR family oxidoreductase n=1 Tax=Haloechinothrix salitolerans TaxID=926830 RepID=A0ABW2C6A5_9PSEU
MSLVVTGATGHLGRLVVEALLDANVPAERIVAAGRDTAKIADLAERGVAVRAIDYEDPASLRAAFHDAERVLLVSSSELGRRTEQHRNVIEAAQHVDLLVYTSIANADRSGLRLAEEHLETEKLLHDARVPVTVLRNGWYLENYTDQLSTYVEHGAVFGSAGDGRVNAATRADYAAAAAAVLTRDGHAGKVYELGGEAFTMSELAAEVSRATGKDVEYRDLSADEYAKLLAGAGLPEEFAAVLADSDVGIARGDLEVASDDLRTLLGRAPTTLAEAVAAAVG